MYFLFKKNNIKRLSVKKKIHIFANITQTYINMKKYLSFLLLCALALPLSVEAQNVNKKKYTDYAPVNNPNPELMTVRSVYNSAGNVEKRPAYVNNAETMHFPPVFNQDGGSCGSASRICYMFTHELNSFRNLNGKQPENYYPSHFVWLLTNGNSGKDEFVTKIGVPSAAIYGGQTYSSLFGNQDCSQNDFGWMQGYDKWYAAMQNRMEKPSNFPMSVGTEAGREAVKNYLWNHNGDPDFHSGGLVGIGLASSGGDYYKKIPSTPTNDEIGVKGKYYVGAWGTQVDHAMTIVGYDDRIEFDLNKNGVYGEKAHDEVGAWILVNSWGTWWGNQGFIYCPYAYAGSYSHADGSFSGDWWYPEIYTVRKNYKPLCTIKLKMDYSRRSELFLSAGISSDVEADAPELVTAFEHFKYAGDGNYGNTNPAPEVPMLGRWADGKLHTEPMEFGYDLTDLAANFYKGEPLKFFFIVQTKAWAKGNGKIYEASIIDYENGIEYPFTIDTKGVDIKNAGGKTIISVVVHGEMLHAPQNAAISGEVFSWMAPIKSANTLTGYKVYCGEELLATLPATTTSYTLSKPDGKVFAVSALYGDRETKRISVAAPAATTQRVVKFNTSGFTIPNVYAEKYEKTTIEYWMVPMSLSDWNQSAGPGWGEFMIHANANGALTAGWNTSDRLNTAAGTLKVNTWKHVAIVVDGNQMTAYIDGKVAGSVTSTGYSGIGGFGDLTFPKKGDASRNYLHANMDEIRIWKTARTAAEINEYKNREFGDAALPEDLLVYYKGDLITENGEVKLRDHVGKNHAPFINKNYSSAVSARPSLSTSVDNSFVTINNPGEVKAGIPVRFSVTCSSDIQRLTWTVPAAEVEGLTVKEPTFTFNEAGNHTVSVVGRNGEGEEITATLTVKVASMPAPDATFTLSSTVVPGGEPVSCLVKTPLMGYLYEWSMPGADKETSTAVNTSATYQHQGQYTITLKVTAPDGRSAQKSQSVSVSEVAPEADFEISPMVVVKGETTYLKDLSKRGPNQWRWSLLSPAAEVVINGQNSSFTPTEPGIYDAVLEVSNGAGSDRASLERALIVCNADSKNGLNFTGSANPSLSVTNVPLNNGLKTFTIDWWMSAAQTSSNFCGIGQDNTSLHIMGTEGKGFRVAIAGSSVFSDDNIIIPGQWHHYAITFNNGKLNFYRDCQLVCSKFVNSYAIDNLSSFTIGTADAPMKGQIDEFRVWGTELPIDLLQAYANEPIENVADAEAYDDLRLYYSFNQSGGNVTDATSNGNDAVRKGFGPDGDAWGLSKGVFCLNFKGSSSVDVTDTYLQNWQAPFENTGKTVNSTNSSRFVGLADWTLEGQTVANGITTGAHVDKDKESYFTVTTLWDNFSTLRDHKVYQTVTLPAGGYTFQAHYGKWEGQPGESYIVVAEGEGLPDTDRLSEALAYGEIGNRLELMNHSIDFTLKEETKVSLGLVINMNDKICMAFERFRLVSSNRIELDADNIVSGIDEAPAAGSKPAAIFDLSGRRVERPVKGGIYIVDGKKMFVR